MKKPKSTTKSSGSITGPTLTNAQKVARDLAEARKDSVKSSAYRTIAGAEKKLGHKTTAAHDMARALKYAGKATKEKLKAARVGYARPVDHRGGWIGGGNDLYPACAAAAAANSLLAATGHQVTDADVLAMHVATGALDTPRWLADIFHELLTGGLAGLRPRTVRSIPTAEARTGAVVVVHVPGWQPHVVTVARAGVATWGALGPARLLEHAVEAWAIDW